jgi:hypothetical protein
MTGVHLNISFAINENYNNFRKSKRTAIRNRILNDLRSKNVDPASRADSIEAQIDSEWDAYKISNWLGSDMPRNQATIDWFERLIEAYIARQCLRPGTMVMEGNRQIDAFGLFEGLDGPGYRQTLLFFYAHEWSEMHTDLSLRSHVRNFVGVGCDGLSPFAHPLLSLSLCHV